jgi:hypothetical protein
MASKCFFEKIGRKWPVRTCEKEAGITHVSKMIGQLRLPSCQYNVLVEGVKLTIKAPKEGSDC